MTAASDTRPSDADAANASAAARDRFDEAVRQARAAEAIAADPVAEPSTAAVHVRSAWQALDELWREHQPSRALPRSRSPAGAPWLPDASEQARTRIAAWLAQAPDTPAHAEDLPTLRSCLRDLATALQTAERRLFEQSTRRRARRQLLLTATAGVALAVPAILLIMHTAPSMGEGPWVAHYHANQSLEGKPVVRHEGAIAYDWDVGAAWDTGPADRFSARWRTCLELPTPTEVSFLLASDDGARLFVDDELVVDNWGRHRHRSRGGRVRLPAGTHELRVDYFDQTGEASVTLHASLDGSRPKALPVRMLHRPDADGC